MFKHILVPLDGSPLAETALPAAVFLADMLGARVTLFHVIERGAPQEVHGARHLRDPEEALAYLDDVAGRAFPAGLALEKHVHSEEARNVAQSIAEHAAELDVDLIAMCTHGRSGLHDWMFGRNAQQVVNRCTTPVLLVQPSGSGAAPTFNCRRLLVALDGNPEHEQGLAVAAHLAQCCNAEIDLVMVVQGSKNLVAEHAATARLLPQATTLLLDLAEQQAVEYLQRHVKELIAAGLQGKGEVRRGDPVPLIIDSAEMTGADLIVLATHGRTGLDAFWAGSATPGVAHHSLAPLLLVPVRGKTH